MNEVHNFNAGPCVLPKEAVESTINAIRNGQKVKAETLGKLANALNVKSIELLPEV